MKKWLAVFLVILLALVMVIPAAADDTPTPTPTPTPTTTPGTPTSTPTPTATPAPAAKLNVLLRNISYQLGEGITGTIQCATIEGGHYEGGSDVGFASSDFTCLGSVILSASVYGNSGPQEQDITVSPGSTGETFYYDADAQITGGTWQTTSVTGTGESTTAIVVGGRSVSSTYPYTVYVYVHASTKAPCSQDFQNSRVVAQGTIDATNQDGYMSPLTIGNYYKLSVWGGPWDDGAAYRYDVATRVDNGNYQTDWIPLDQFAETNLSAQCTEADQNDPTKTIVIFQATDTDPRDTIYDWSIRVNDIDGMFANNTGSMEYELDEVSENPQGCQTQYLQGTQIQGGTIAATNSAGVYNHIHPANVTDPWIAGSWIEIVTSGGPWQDGGVPPDRYDIAIQNLDGSWSPLSGSPYTSCTSVTNGYYITAYYQLPNSNGVYLRVNDTGGVWTNNTGSMDFAIYSVTYSPNPASGCAENYQIGTLIKSVTATANLQSGASVGNLGNGGIDVTQGGESDLRYYAIETSGIYYNGSVAETGGGIATSQNTTTPPVENSWNYLQNAPGVVCAVPLDPIGHIRVYMPMDLIVNYWVRAQALGMSQNWPAYSGSLTFSIYKATNLQVPGYTPGTMPGATVCDALYTKGAAGSTYVIDGNNEGGVPISLLSGHVYAVETTLGPWQNNDVASYEVAISEDGGGTWTNLVAFAASDCAESPDGNHILVYFQALAGRSYKFRVYDPGEDFTDNTDSISLILYNNVIVGIAPWSTCADNYSLTQVAVADPTIPTTNISLMTGMSGPPVTVTLTPGASYAIEISQAAWFYVLNAPDTHYYASNISIDNASTWTPFGPALSGTGAAFGATCIIQTNQATAAAQATYRVYFKAGNGVYKMQVDATSLDVGGIFGGTVGGNLTYILYQTSPAITQNPPTNPPGSPIITPPPGWQILCYENYTRPTGFFENTPYQLPDLNFGSIGTITFPIWQIPLPNLDQWITYLQWAVRSYFAWCPDDTAALSAIPTALNQYEPFGSINDVYTIMQTVRSDVSSAQASGGEGANFAPHSILFNIGGGESTDSFQGIMPVLSSDSPWMGGKIVAPQLTAPTLSGIAQSYYYYCVGAISARTGPGLAVGECAVLALAKTAPLFWLLAQLLADAGSIFLFIKYIQSKWVDAGASG